MPAGVFEGGRSPSRVKASQSACPAREHVGAYGHTLLPPCGDFYPLGESTSFLPNPLMTVLAIVEFPGRLVGVYLEIPIFHVIPAIFKPEST